MGYKVTDTQRMTNMTPAGGTVTTYRVWIVTDRGATGQVDVPVDAWNEKDLPVLLKAEAAKLDLAFTVGG
uniref:Uncharacterized protein n=1 Tax=viral metagenome TaxID=1070528 RepID=A0A6M3LND7_9ZZZZ